MLRTICYLLGAVTIAALLTTQAALAKSYTISMLPRYSTEEIHKRVSALAKYLSESTGLEIKPVLTSTFAEYQKQLANGAIDIGLQNPYIYVLAAAEHEVIAMVVKGRDGDKFRGIIVVPTGSDLNVITDLKGKTISIVSYTSAGGYLSQRLSLMEQNIDVTRDCKIEVAPENKQENVMFAVFTGDVDAGFIRESALGQVKGMIPEGAIQVMTGTAWLPNWALSVNRSMADVDKKKITEAIKNLPTNSPVFTTLKIKALRMAKDSEYDPVRKAAGIEIVAEGVVSQ